MSVGASITLAATMLVENPRYATLALCATYAMGDKRFRDLVAALVELDPRHWPLALEFVESITAGRGPAGGAASRHLSANSSA